MNTTPHNLFADSSSRSHKQCCGVISRVVMLAFLLSSQVGDAGSYLVSVGNAGGTALSEPAAVTIAPALQPPVITQHPLSQSVNVGASVTFSVQVTGKQPFTYQWRKNGEAIPGKTGASLTLNNVQQSDATGYSVVIANADGSVGSNTAMLIVEAAATPPQITQNPQSQSVSVGANVTLAVTAAGTPPLSYQWKKGGADLSGAAGATLTLRNVQASDAGNYTVAVSNAAGTTLSEAATVTVAPALQPPVITQHPLSQSVNAGGSVTFTVQATGREPLAYQWRKNGEAIAGATGASLTLNNVQASDAGSYTVSVSNAAGTALSEPATVTIPPAGAPAITQLTVSPTTPRAGDILTIRVVATGPSPLMYQWSRNGIAIANATSAIFQISNVQEFDSGNYSVTVRNSIGSTSSGLIPVAISPAPLPLVITQEPRSQTVNLGDDATFTVGVSGEQPINYQWKKDGVNIDGATGAKLTIASVAESDAADYRVAVNDSTATVVSSPATLTVYTAPVIRQQPQSKIVNVNDAVTFAVVATGTVPFAYQWRKNNIAIPGATSAALTFALVQESDAGVYRVIVSNSDGNTDSTTATLTVRVPPRFTQQPVAQTVSVGANVTMAVTVAGTLPISFQWLKNGVPISGATQTTLILTNVQFASAGDYSVILTNVAGQETSTTATLVVNPPPSQPPVITVQPQNRTVIPYEPFTFSVAATGTLPLSYQWFKDGVPILGAASFEFAFAQPITPDAGTYSVTVSNIAGSTRSTNAVLVVSPPASGDRDYSFQFSVQGWVKAIAVQSNGKIVIGGRFLAVGGNSRNGIARLNSDGTLDETFLNGLTGTDDEVAAVAVQDDGKILIGGLFTSVNDDLGYRRIARLHEDGSVDTAFPRARLVNDVLCMLVQADGKVLIGGLFTSIDGVSCGYLARLNADGTLDTTFLRGLSGANSDVLSIAQQSDGKILIGGRFTTVNGVSRNRLARLNSDGTLDTRFLGGLSGADGSVFSIVVQDDERVLIGGNFRLVNGVDRGRVARLNSDGSLDTQFGDGLAGANSYVYSIARQNDGKILIGGYFSTVNGLPRGYVARLNVDGTLDRGAQPNSSVVYAIARHTNGRMLIGASGVMRIWDRDFPPRITGVSREGENVRVLWHGAPNRPYRMQYKARLSDNDWSDLPGDVLAPDRAASKTDSTQGADGHRFYRVLLLP